MKYFTKDFGSYKLHMIKTNKFKTIKIRVCFRSPIVKNEITMRNILCDVLANSSKNYSTKRDLIIKSQDLYAANVVSNNSRIGNYINTDVVLTVLNDKYTEAGNYKDAVSFLKEVIFNPNVSDNKFSSEVVDMVKANAKTSLEGLKEDASYYSVLRLFESMDKNSPMAYRMCGYLEDLDKMDIFVIGDINFKETEELIKDNFKLRTFKKQRIGYVLEDKKARGRRFFVKEEDENSQSKLTIGCRIHKLSPYERNYPLTLYNIILGSGTDSKLFKKFEQQEIFVFPFYYQNRLSSLFLLAPSVAFFSNGSA